ncbi:hypothetical protein U1Q18_049052, partial [Sarracenia purpurea var. burkii]
CQLTPALTAVGCQLTPPFTQNECFAPFRLASLRLSTHLPSLVMSVSPLGACFSPFNCQFTFALILVEYQFIPAITWNECLTLSGLVFSP